MTARYSRRTALRRGLLAVGSAGAAWATFSGTTRTLAHVDEQLNGDAALAAANLDFAFRLFRQLARAKGQNTFISPLSVSIALTMTANGARGATRQAILNTLALGQMPLPSLNGASAALIGGLGAR